MEENIPLGLPAGLALTFLTGGGGFVVVRFGPAASCKAGGGGFPGGGANLASCCNVGGGAFPFGSDGGAFFGYNGGFGFGAAPNASGAPLA